MPLQTLKMTQQTKTELSKGTFKTYKHRRGHAKTVKGKNEIVQEQKQLIDEQAQTTSEKNHVIEKQKQQIELKDNANAYQCRMIDNFNRKSDFYGIRTVRYWKT